MQFSTLKSHCCAWRTASRLTLSLAFGLTLPAASHAQVQLISLDFNDVLPGSDISTQYLPSQGVTFSLFPANPFLPGVYADNPGLGPNPTQANNTLIGIFGAVQMFLPTAPIGGYNAFKFEVIPDPSDLAGLSVAPVLFLDAAGSVVDTLNVDQTIGGAYTYRGRVFQSVILPADADYDNIVAVPEPGSIALFGSGAVFLTGLAARRRQRSQR